MEVLAGLLVVSLVLIDDSETPEADALAVLISNLPRDVDGELVVLAGLPVVSLALIDVSEIPEIDALVALISNVPGDV